MANPSMVGTNLWCAYLKKTNVSVRLYCTSLDLILKKRLIITPWIEYLIISLLKKKEGNFLQ